MIENMSGFSPLGTSFRPDLDFFRSLLWQGESDNRIPQRFLTDSLVPARRDHQVLFAIDLVGHRGSIPGGRQYRIPNLFPILGIECPDTRVGGPCDEYQATFGGDRTA